MPGKKEQKSTTRKIPRAPIQRSGQFCVYMVECKNGTYYTGYTSDLEKRIQMHNSGQGSKYLRGKGPVRLVYKRKFVYYMHALRVEREIKQLSREQKDKLVKAYASKMLRTCS